MHNAAAKRQRMVGRELDFPRSLQQQRTQSQSPTNNASTLAMARRLPDKRGRDLLFLMVQRPRRYSLQAPLLLTPDASAPMPECASFPTRA